MQSDEDLIKSIRGRAERFARDDAREDLDAQEWGEAMTVWEVLALCDLAERLRAERDDLRAAIATAREAHGDPMTAAILDIVRRESEQETAKQIAAWLDCTAERAPILDEQRLLTWTAKQIRAGSWRTKP